MNRDDSMGSVKWALGVGVLFLISCFMCYDELAYQISGETAEAVVTKSYSSSGRRGRTNATVEYAWAEKGGAQRKDMFTTDPESALAPGTKLPIRYTPGETGRSRRVGHVPWIWITIFLGSLAGMGVVGFLLWREATEDDRRGARKRT